VVGLAAEKGRNGAESSSSPSASDKVFIGALVNANRGLRDAKARLLDMGWGASESDEEELDDELAIADGLASLGRKPGLSCRDTSVERSEAFRLPFPKDECLSVVK
jgi:hypothetical protein